MKSLIQQRMALGRMRARGIAECALGGIFTLLAVVQLTRSPIISWIWVVFGVGVLGYGIVILVRNRRETRSFDREHGADAGKQKSAK